MVIATLMIISTIEGNTTMNVAKNFLYVSIFELSLARVIDQTLQPTSTRSMVPNHKLGIVMAVMYVNNSTRRVFVCWIAL